MRSESRRRPRSACLGQEAAGAPTPRGSGSESSWKVTSPSQSSPSHASDRWICSTDSSTSRLVSVFSIRSRNSPASWRAKSQLKSGRADASDVEEAGGAGREAGADGHRAIVLRPERGSGHASVAATARNVESRAGEKPDGERDHDEHQSFHSSRSFSVVVHVTPKDARILRGISRPGYGVACSPAPTSPPREGSTRRSAGRPSEARTLSQIFTQSPRAWRPTNHPPKNIERFKQARAEAGIGAVVCHAVYLINLATTTAEIWEKSRRAPADRGGRPRDRGRRGRAPRRLPPRRRSRRG